MSEENVEIVRRCVEGRAPGSAVIDELCEFVDAGDRVVVAVHVSGRMKGGDAPIAPG